MEDFQRTIHGGTDKSKPSGKEGQSSTCVPAFLVPSMYVFMEIPTFVQSSENHSKATHRLNLPPISDPQAAESSGSVAGVTLNTI